MDGTTIMMLLSFLGVNFNTKCLETFCYILPSIFGIKRLIISITEDNASREDGPWAGLIRTNGQYYMI